MTMPLGGRALRPSAPSRRGSTARLLGLGIVSVRSSHRGRPASLAMLAGSRAIAAGRAPGAPFRESGPSPARRAEMRSSAGQEAQMRAVRKHRRCEASPDRAIHNRYGHRALREAPEPLRSSGHRRAASRSACGAARGCAVPDRGRLEPCTRYSGRRIAPRRDGRYGWKR